jgi:hypothetical protein
VSIYQNKRKEKKKGKKGGRGGKPTRDYAQIVLKN